MPDIHLTVDINRPPQAVFELIADIAHYRRWLAISQNYVDTINISDTPIKVGTTYIDQTPTRVVLHGEVREYQPYSRIVFFQESQQDGLHVTISYALSPTGNGTHVERTTNVRTSKSLRLLQPLVVRRIRGENKRTLAALKAYLEAGAS